MDDALLDQREIRYPIAIQTAISRERRLRLPEFLKIPAPFVLVENSLPEQLWLGICSIDFWAKITAEYDDGLRMLAEYRTYRPTIPNAVCSKHCLQCRYASLASHYEKLDRDFFRFSMAWRSMLS